MLLPLALLSRFCCLCLFDVVSLSVMPLFLFFVLSSLARGPLVPVIVTDVLYPTDMERACKSQTKKKSFVATGNFWPSTRSASGLRWLRNFGPAIELFADKIRLPAKPRPRLYFLVTSQSQSRHDRTFLSIYLQTHFDLSSALKEKIHHDYSYTLLLLRKGTRMRKLHIAVHH